MKNYVKPTVDVVELSVTENMAALPYAVTSVTGETGKVTVSGTEYDATVYNLVATSDSVGANG